MWDNEIELNHFQSLHLGSRLAVAPYLTDTRVAMISSSVTLGREENKYISQMLNYSFNTEAGAMQIKGFMR